MGLAGWPAHGIVDSYRILKLPSWARGRTAPVLSLLQRSTGGVCSRGPFGHEGDNGFAWGSLGLRVDDAEERRMKVVYLTLSLLPTAAVVTLAWYVVRAISVRIVWRERDDRRLGDKPA